MPTTVLTMLAEGNYTSYVLGAGASKVAAVNADDADTSWIYTGSTGAKESFTLTGYDAIPDNVTIEKIEHSMRVREEIGAHSWGFQGGFRLNATDNFGTQNPTTGSYQLFTEEIARPGGGAWSKDDLSTLEWVVQTYGTSDGHSQRVTYAYVTVTWLDRIVRGWLQSATHKLFSSRQLSAFVTVVVPWRFLAMELGEPMNASLQFLPSSASALDGIAQHALVKNWRRQFGTLVSIKPIPTEHAAELTFRRREHQMATYFTSDQLSGPTTSERQGLARMDTGGTFALTRATAVLVPQENDGAIDLSLVPLASSDGQGFLEAQGLEEKMNHLGFLSEEAVDQDIIDSCFNDGFTYWTAAVNGSGAISAISGDHHAFPQSVSDTAIFIFGDLSVTNYIHPATDLSVLSADGYRKIACIHSDPNSWPTQFALQRSTDSWWWNDTSEAWQSGEVWNDFTLGYSVGIERHVLSYSNPIPVDNDETWQIRIGIENATTGHWVYLVQTTIGKYSYLPVKTGTAGITTEEDDATVTLDVDMADPVRQLFYAGRGTVSFVMTARQDAAWMADEDAFALLTLQNDNTENNFDVIRYRKPTGGNARFEFCRFIESGGSPSLDATAYYEVDISPGTEYAVECVYTSDSDGELGLPARTLRIRIDKVNGVDDQASQSHSTSERYTKLWKGCSPAGEGSLRAMNYIRSIRIQPRCVPDEEAIS